MIRFPILAATLVVLVSARSEQYCHLESCNNHISDPMFRVVPQDHTACRFSNRDVGALCGSMKSRGVTAAEKREILKVHNNHRRYVAAGKERRGSPGPQPPAKHMPDLQWSDEYAHIAQLWANQCDDSHHDKCRNTRSSKVGQNMAWSSAYNKPTENITELINGWYNEVEHFDRRQAGSLQDTTGSGQVVTHYTQMVWAKTTLVGCGIARYTTNDRYDNIFIVCNYGPSGNWIGEPVYEISDSDKRITTPANYDNRYNQRNPVVQYDHRYPVIRHDQRNPVTRHVQRNPVVQYDHRYPVIRHDQRDHVTRYDQRNPVVQYDRRYPVIRHDQRDHVTRYDQRNPVTWHDQRTPMIRYDRRYPAIRNDQQRHERFYTNFQVFH